MEDISSLEDFKDVWGNHWAEELTVFTALSWSIEPSGPWVMISFGMDIAAEYVLKVSTWSKVISPRIFSRVKSSRINNRSYSYGNTFVYLPPVKFTNRSTIVWLLSDVLSCAFSGKMYSKTKIEWILSFQTNFIKRTNPFWTTRCSMTDFNHMNSRFIRTAESKIGYLDNFINFPFLKKILSYFFFFTWFNWSIGD